MKYEDFIASKFKEKITTGLHSIPPLNSALMPYQRDIVSWALRRGRAAIFADCGMGKTLMQLEFAACVPGDVLIIAPLAVAAQTIRESEKFGCVIPIFSHDGKKRRKITITNYDVIEKFDLSEYAGIVLDESSILKSYTGKYCSYLIENCERIPFKLACTATPAPNDFMEIGTHSEFLGVMNRPEMLATYFVHDGGETQKWRLKGHAQELFWKWICSWAVMIRKPSDLGYSDCGFNLPALNITQAVVHSESNGDYLFAMQANTLQERQRARKDSIDDRVAMAAEIVKSDKTAQWLLFCNLNEESDKLTKAIEGAVEVKGSDKDQHKEDSMKGFACGDVRVLVSKPSICGFGMNFQSCHNVIFVGLSDSYEQYYQSIRRCWRFGQKHDVNVYVVTADTEGAVVENIKRKDAESSIMIENMVKHMSIYNQENIKGNTMEKPAEQHRDVAKSDKWTMHLGDCVKTLSGYPDEYFGFSIFSPPFASLYTYSDSEYDMGNCKNDDLFYEQFKYLVKELYRVIKSGRNVSFHCMNLPTSKVNHGHIGIRDFRGDLIRIFESEGFIFHSEVCIWKDPVVAMQRTKAIGLLHKQMVKDSAMSRQGIPDYLVTMRKPGENAEPVHGELSVWAGDDSFKSNGRLSIDLWQRYASPVWMDINPSRTLQKDSQRNEKDERHICPLQLDVIDRALLLWSNENDIVLSPFAGIGSEGHCSINLGRKFVGIELKPEYYEQACRNIERAERESIQVDLFNYK